MGVEVLVPFIVFGSIVLIVAMPFYFKRRNRRVIYDAIKTSVEKTGEADPKLIAAITHDTVGPNADLRRGILLLSFATALLLIGVFAGGDVEGFPFWAISLIPGLIGAAYVGLHFFAPREPTV